MVINMSLKKKLQAAEQAGYERGLKENMNLVETRGFVKGAQETWNIFIDLVPQLDGIGPKTKEKLLRAIKEKSEDEVRKYRR